MILARFIGDTVEGVWTHGRLYIVFDEFTDREKGYAPKAFKVEAEDHAREVPVETFAQVFLKETEFPAVVVKAFGAYDEGVVLMLTEASDDGTFFQVKDNGYHRKEHFELLDSTNLVVGSLVRDPNGYWGKVEVVDWFHFEVRFGSPTPLPMLRCVFPVRDGAVLSEPSMVCVRPEPGRLTQGKAYRPLFEVDGRVAVEGDDGQAFDVMRDRFK